MCCMESLLSSAQLWLHVHLFFAPSCGSWRHRNRNSVGSMWVANLFSLKLKGNGPEKKKQRKELPLEIPTWCCQGSINGNLPALRIQISGHGFINITAESAFWTNGLWTRAFSVCRSLKGLPKPFEWIFERKWNVIWTPFWTFLEMDKSCVPVATLAVSEKKALTLWTKCLLYLVLQW